MTESSAYWEDKDTGFGLDCLLFQRDNDPSWSPEDTLGISHDMSVDEQRGGEEEEEGENAFESLITDSLLELETGSGFHFLTNASLFSEEDVDQCLREQGGRSGGLFEGGVLGSNSGSGGGRGRPDEDSLSLPSSSTTSSSLESPGEGKVGGGGEVQCSLKCSECSKTFSNPLTLQVHMRLHTGERPYKCKQCGEGFIHYTYLEFHNKNSHGGGGAEGTPNPPTPLSFNWEETECNPKRDQLDQLSSSKKKSSGQKKHSKVGKLNGEAIKVSINEKQGVKHKSSGNNSSEEDRERPHECTTCGKRFLRLDNLKIHLRMHSGERPFGCEVCNKYFRQQSSMQRHMKNLHQVQMNRKNRKSDNQDLKETPSNKKIETESQSNHFNAEPCQMRLTHCDNSKNVIKTGKPNQSKLTSHKIESIQLNLKDQNRDVEFKLFNLKGQNVDVKQVNLKGQNVEPIQVNLKGQNVEPIQVNLKGQNVEPIQVNLKGQNVEPIQVNLKGQNVEPIQVNLKDQNVEVKQANLKGQTVEPKQVNLKLGQNVEPKQTGEPKVEVGALLFALSVLKTETAPTTSNTAEFVCETCGKQLSRKNYLIEHMRKHTGEKPYECPKCGDRFSRLNSFWIHKRKHNYPDGKPFNCQNCDKRFSQKVYLLNHVKKGACHTP